MEVDLLLKRLKREFTKVNVLQASLDAIIAFLAANLALFLLSIQVTPQLSNPVALGIAAVFFLLADLYHRNKQYRLEIYEEKNPEFREILRTARDNREKDDVVSWAMFLDLLERARTVPSDRIVPSTSIIKKILVVTGLSLLTILSGVTDFHIQQQGGQLLPNVRLDAFQGEENDTLDLRDANEVYGDAEDIRIEDLDLGVNITGSGEEARDGGPYADEADIEELTLDRSGRMTLAGDLELAKRYSLALKNITAG